ncbi:serpin family protein [Bacteroidota bacterium]
MKKINVFIVSSLLFSILCFMLSILTGCSDPASNLDNDNDQRQPIEISALEKEVANSASSFGFKIFDAISQSSRSENIFISPLSISMALGMTLNGAAGDTYTAMRQTLELNGLSEEQINFTYQTLIATLMSADAEVNFEIANSIWYRNTMTFEQLFIQTNIDYFDAVVQGMDFNDPQTVNVINQWISDNTNGNIDEVIDQIDPITVMFLINALYFKGTWEKEFNAEATVDDIFINDNTEQIACEMMVQENEYLYYENDLFQAVNLPYGDGQFYMTVLLPKDQNVVETIIEEMNSDNWSQWLTGFTETELILRLPKFKLEYEIELKDVLTELGMGVAFTDGADFTRMYAPGSLAISKVKHKSFIEVNEEGTEASAVTVVEIVLTSAGGDTLTMNVNKPFLFLIHEVDSEAILFMGKICNPVE